MNYYGWLIFLHIAGIILYVGGDIILNILALKFYKDHDASGFLKIVKSITPVVGIGAILTLPSGIGLVLQSSTLSFSMFWILSGLFIVVVAGIFESIYFSKQVRTIQSILTEKGPADIGIAARMRHIIKVAAVINLLFLIVIWLMVFKPNV
ncbi:MAG: hypothetical protein P8Y79_13640 [Ignavibacteriaceae bacterium]